MVVVVAGRCLGSLVVVAVVAVPAVFVGCFVVVVLLSVWGTIDPGCRNPGSLVRF